MKVMIVNGSSHENGTTMVAINEMIKVFDEEGVETEVIQLGSKPIPDCLQCNYCVKNGRCVFDDEVNEFVEKAADADGSKRPQTPTVLSSPRQCTTPTPAAGSIHSSTGCSFQAAAPTAQPRSGSSRAPQSPLPAGEEPLQPLTA